MSARTDLITQIRHILDGIDRTETDTPPGWWETSYGATMGAHALDAIITAINNVPTTTPDTPTDVTPQQVRAYLDSHDPRLRTLGAHYATTHAHALTTTTMYLPLDHDTRRTLTAYANLLQAQAATAQNNPPEQSEGP